MMQEMEKDRNVVKTEISIHPDLEERISKFQMETLNEEIASLPPIKEGDVNISTDFIFDIGDKYEASIFIRNGLNRPINFEQVPFVLVNDKGEVVGHKIFNLREIGEIPPLSVRPWKLYFGKEEIDLGDNELKDVKIVFDTRVKAERTLKLEYEDFPKEIKGVHRDKYEKFLSDLPLLRNGQVSISAYNVDLNENGGLSIVLVIRNGSDRQIKLEKLPITVKDARDIEIARGVFELKDEGITVNPLKAKLYSFVFPKENILQDELHLSKWSVSFNN
ncbi:SLAP domain-containing protein [Clostridium bovifaecis]|uniref:SLAP domain-containing protein n=1 Tax=Clostridium bovifaecis TaxID=2184719 RepID=A0A6I6F5T3_9CLOT|nr:SLAP domain-containing protein [Clostridium bovifaecis]